MMAFKLMVRYNDAPVVYDVTRQEDDVYLLRLQEGSERNTGDGYVPQKMIIRKKGKIWISDVEDYRQLVDSLTAEIMQFGIAEEKITNE